MRRNLAFMAVLCLAAISAATATAQTTSLRGRSLAEALRVLEGRGLRLIYSTDVVRPEMIVGIEPRSTEPRQMLDELLREHHVDVNILCTVHAANQDHALEVYRFFRDDLGARYLQLIPIVERDNETGYQEGNAVTERSVDPDAWGRFLGAVFDEWVRRDVGTMFVQMFDAALASWVGIAPSMCIFREECGDAVVLEHNGDLYSCDHFVEPGYLLGNVMHTSMVELVASPRQRAFGAAKRDTLPRYCRECEVRFACNGECPKNRFTLTPDGEPGLNYLCAGYKAFFTHVDGLMRIMAERLRTGRAPADVMDVLASAPRNEPCPCGSGRKAKLCHAR